jgi:hypothetical protein
MNYINKKSSIKLDYLVPRGGLEPPRREALTPEASVSTNSTTEACIFRQRVWCLGGDSNPHAAKR